MINISKVKSDIKEFIKKIGNHSIARKIAAWTIHIYTSMVFKTSRVIFRDRKEEINRLLDEGNGMVLFCWHGRTIITPPAMKTCFKNYLKTKKINLLSSVHRDGK